MIVIGEKINATRKSIRKALDTRAEATIKSQIVTQVEAGAGYIDLNAGNKDGDRTREKEDMRWLIDLALDCTEKPLCIDSGEAEIIADAAEYLVGKRPWMLNSVKNEEHVLDSLMPLVAQYAVGVVGLAMHGDAIPEDVEERLASCRAIMQRAEKEGIKPEQVYFDPLVMPISTNYTFGKTTLLTLRAIKRELPGAKTVMGLSNISFHLPQRSRINGAFLIASMANGLDAAFCDPCVHAINEAILLGTLVCGKDRHCRKFSRAVRNGFFEESKS